MINFLSKNHLFNILIGVIFLILISFIACIQEEIDIPKEQKEVEKASISDLPVFTNADTESFTALHRDIFEADCAIPGCHDGYFEPDFRTVQSAYSTLVYHPVIKNNARKSFKYRVVPFDTASSVLFERITNCCFANENDRMPQVNIGQSLEHDKVQRIGRWILDGAKDYMGKIPDKPGL